MTFEPAIRPRQSATPPAWCRAFIDGQLLLPEAGAAALQPQPLQAFEPLAASRHDLGRLDALACRAFGLRSAPAGWRIVALRSALAGFVEPGESLEQCIRSEVAERSACRCANCATTAAGAGRFRTA